MKVLTLVSPWSPQPSLKEMLRDEELGRSPRQSLYQHALGSVNVDRSYFQQLPAWKRRLYRLLPQEIARAIEGYLQRTKYDAVVTWSESLTIGFALLLKITRRKFPHVALVYSISRTKKAWSLRAVASHVDRFVMWTSHQREFALNRLHIPPAKIVWTGYLVDHLYYKPMSVQTDTISSAEREMRDYRTLVRALEGLRIPCHIAARETPGKNDRWVQDIRELSPLPSDISIGPLKDLNELRLLYARSKFVVLPLLENDADSGTTVILEAMAMGKAVICTRTSGQRDNILEGETGMYVPVGDAEALRKAILYLWENPGVAESMGKRGRDVIEQHHTLDGFVEVVRTTVDEVLREYREGRT